MRAWMVLARSKHSGQILYQLPEVHPIISGEEKENFAAVKGILRRDQLHVQLVLLNFLLADVKGPLLLHLVVGQDSVVCFRSQADDPAQGRDNVPEGNLVIATGTGAVLWSPGGFDDDVVTGGNGEIAGGEIVYFGTGPELDVYHVHRSVPVRRHGAASKIRRWRLSSFFVHGISFCPAGLGNLKISLELPDQVPADGAGGHVPL